MNLQTKIPSQPIETTQRLLRKMALLALTTVLVAVALLMAYGLALPALAQNDESALGSLNLTSDTPGEIEVSWTAPSLAPSDYRMSWTPDGEAYPSYKDANQADRGNSYPEGDQTSLTLTGLTPGTEYKVHIRARYNDGEHADQPWAGPWREAAVTVAGGEEPAPTPVPEPTPTPVPEPTPTPTPVPEPTPTPTPDPADHGVIQGLSLASSEPGQLVVTWEIPETTPTDYRISWAQSSLSFPSYKDSNGPEKGNLSPLGSTTTLTLDNLTPGVDYKIKMRARYYNADRSEHLSSGPWTDAVTQRVRDHPPAAPTGLTTSDIEHDSMTLTWDDPENDSITGYRVLRGPDADSLSTLENDTRSVSTEYEDPTVSSETTYFYGLLAMSQDGNSVQSDAISATTPAAPSSGQQDATREAPRKQDPPPRVGARQVSTSTTDVWTATLTPADFGSGNLGCNNASASATQKCSTATVLSDDDFTYDSTEYSLTILYLTATAFSLTVDADITAATNDLTIVVGSTSLAFADATTQTPRIRTWFNPGFSWTAGTDVSIRITDLAPPSLTSAVVLADGNTIQLAFSEDLQSANLPPAAAFTVTAGGGAVTVTGVAAESTADVLQITVSPLIGQGQTVVVAYEDPTAVDDANAIQDAAGNDTPDFTTGSGSVPAVTNNSALINEVLASWSLTPAGLAVGDQFRLIFLSSTKRNALSTDIGDYNTFVQDRAATGHAGIQAYSGGFGVIGCTAAVDARDNTATTGTGVPIYWLDGAKVADDYADFYDGSWADEVNDKNESGADAHDTSQSDNYPFTGCKNDGTEESAGAHSPRSLGSTDDNVRIGRLNSTGTLQDPIDGNGVAATSATRPMYGLSAVFEVSSSPSTNPSVPAAITDLAVVPEPRTTDSLRVSWTAPDNTGKPALTGYDLRYKGTASDAEWVVVTQAGTGASGTLTGLDESTDYLVEVRALNAEYSGPWSSTAEGTTTGPPEVVLANHPLVPDDLGPGDSFRLLYVTSDTTAATGTGIHEYDSLVTNDPFQIVTSGNLLALWDGGIRLSQTALVSTAGADARLHTDTTWTGTDRGVPIYWVNGARVADDYEDFYDGSWGDEANPMNGLGEPRSLAGTAPWTGTSHDGTELFEGGVSRAVGQSMVGVGAPDSAVPGAGPLNGGGTFASTEKRPLYALWDVMVIDENLRLAGNLVSAARRSSSDERAAVRAQLFTTGSHPDGYSISEIKVRRGSADPADAALGAVALYTRDGSGDPDLVNGLHATLSLESTASIFWHLETPEGTVLEASTTYALVFQGAGGAYPILSTSSADGEDAVVDGWSIADVLRHQDGSNWGDHPDGNALTMDIIGTLADVATDVWTATLTPADIGNNIIGCDSSADIARDCSTAAILSDDAFTYDSQNYTIAVLYLDPDGDLTFSLSANMTTATQGLTLVIDGTSFVLANADGGTGSAPTRTWNTTSLSWTIGTDVNVKLTATAANTAPTVANPIPNRTATVGTEFSYTFLANTFNDVDATDTLTYSAKKADDSALPTWLTFTDTTRTFSGTPTAAETVSVKVTASDGTASVSDEFDIMVSAAPMPLAVTQQEDRPYAFTESDFSNLPGGRVTLTKVIITELPNNGWLARSKSVLLPSGNRQLQSDRIYSRHLPLTLSTEVRRLSLAFFPEANGNGTPYASFKFKVNSSSEEHTMLVNITPVNDPAYGRVFINGTTLAGYTLTAFTSSIGDRDGIPRDQLNYQWKRYAANGTTFETNIGANSNTYTLTNSEQGKKIKLEIRFTDNDGTDEGPLTSPAFPYIATQTIGDATFISTIGMAGDSFHTFASQDQGQVFTTGGHPNGYTVTSVVIISEDSAGDDVALKICEVDENLHPTAVCTDLTAPGSSPAGPLVFTAPSGTTLTGGRTNYMVVFDSPGGEHVQLDAHKSDGYDSNSLPGFSIRSRIHNKTGTGWQETSYRRGLRIAVLGTINP